MGAQLVKEAAVKTNDTVGDGTTTATVIAQAIVKQGMSAIEGGGNPVLVKRGIDIAVNALVDRLQTVSHPVSTEEDYARVASISANDDYTIGRVVAKALHTVGDDGVVTVDDTPLPGVSVDFVEDFEFDNGYVSPYMVTNPGTLEAIVDDPYILFTAHRIKDVQQIMPVLDRIMRNDRRPLVIVAETVEGTALQMLVHNHVNGHFQAVAIKAPGFGEKRIHLLEDMAALCGGQVHSRAPRSRSSRSTSSTWGAPCRCGSPARAPRSSGWRGQAEAGVPAVAAARRAGPRDHRHRRGLLLRPHRPAVREGRDHLGRGTDQRRGPRDPAPCGRLVAGDPGRGGRGHRGRWRAALLHAEPPSTSWT